MRKDVKNVIAAGIPNVNMVIYTKTGDDGLTSLLGGKRLPKSSPQFETEGSLDELSSFTGLVITKKITPDDKKILRQIQKDLYLIMAIIAGKKNPIINLGIKVKGLERKIDLIQSQLSKLHRFIIPGGTETGAWFHVLRTVCRRSERNIVGYFKTLKIEKRELEILSYINRLSDLFFMMARQYSQGKEKTL